MFDILKKNNLSGLRKFEPILRDGKGLREECAFEMHAAQSRVHLFRADATRGSSIPLPASSQGQVPGN